MRVTLCTIQWKWQLQDNESTTNLLRMVRAIRFVEKGHNQIVHIIIYSWHYRWHKVYITVIMATDMLYITVIMATDMLYITVIMATGMLYITVIKAKGLL
jgi:hypothetical protein